MTAWMDKQATLVSLIEEANKYNIKVLSPDINTSDTNFIAKKGKIFFGLAGIKGVGVVAVDNIVAVRKEKPFNSVFDFALRTEHCNKRILEALICSGAFDSIHTIKSRSQLFASVDLILDYSKKVTARNNNEIDDMFAVDDSTPTIQPPSLIFAPDWDDFERINKEMEYLNFYLSGHPLDKYYPIIMSLNSVNLTPSDEDEDETNKESISIYGYVSGLINGVRKREDKNKNTIAFAQVQTYSGSFELIFWSDAYKKYKDIIVEGKVICCQGKIEKEGNEMAKVSVDEAYEISEAISRYTEGIELKIEQNSENISKLDVIKEYHNNSLNLNNSKIFFNIYNNETAYLQKYCATNINISYSLDTIIFFVELFEKENVALVVKPPTPTPSSKKN